jgi:CarD family transcriptional regulator
MAQNKKVTSTSAAKAASSPSALKHKSAGVSKPEAKLSENSTKTASTPTAEAKRPAAKTSAKDSTPAKPAQTKVDVKSVAKSTDAPAAAAKVGASKAAKPKATEAAAAPAASATAPAKSVFNKGSVQAAAGRAAGASPAKAMPAAVAKPTGQRISAPVPPKTAPAPVVNAAAAAAAAAAKKSVSARHGFKTNEYIVYPAHGVGRIVGIEEQEIAGMALELFVITFDKDKMTLRVPTGKLQSVGMRKLAEEPVVRRAMETLKGRARVKRTMWSRRAQEYEAKINSGDLVAIAEVVRDLYRSETQPEQSYSERQLYEAALDRMAREIAAVEKLDERGAVQRITEILAKSAKGRRLAAEGAEAEAAGVEAEAEEGDDATGVKAA